MAISLGRRMQEPLHEFSSLMASEDEEVLALKMHSFQDSLSKVACCSSCHCGMMDVFIRDIIMM